MKHGRGLALLMAICLLAGVALAGETETVQNTTKSTTISYVRNPSDFTYILSIPASLSLSANVDQKTASGDMDISLTIQRPDINKKVVVTLQKKEPSLTLVAGMGTDGIPYWLYVGSQQEKAVDVGDTIIEWDPTNEADKQQTKKTTVLSAVANFENVDVQPGTYSDTVTFNCMVAPSSGT